MAKKTEIKNFDLQKVKIQGKKGLHIEYFDLTQKNDLITIDSDSAYHEDFENKLNEFKHAFASSIGLLNGWDFARDHLKSNDERLREAINSWNQEIERFTISGVVFVGPDENPGIKLTGSLKTDLGTVGLPSPIIRFSEEEIVNGEGIKELFEDLKKEVWKFIFNGKRIDNLFSVSESEKEEKEDKSGLNNTTLKAV